MNAICKRAAAIVVMAIIALGLTTCKKEKIDAPTVKVFEGAITINYTKVSVSAEVIDQGGAEVQSRGFVYGLSGGNFDTIFCGSGVGVYSADFNNLQPNTTYVYEAFAKNPGGTGTSGKVTFTTRDHELPIVKTAEVDNVGTTSASCGGNVTGDGGANITERGVCWSTNHNPSVSESHVSAGSGLGEYTCNMTNLSANTTYYLRAYAKNSKGVGYGEEKQFTTLDFDLPEVITANVNDITQSTAKGGGEVTSDGGTTVTERGLCWSTSHNPSISGSHANNGSGTGNFTCNITGLNAHTKYYVRAYATNSKGTAYGEEVNFTTSANKPTVSTGSVTNITTTTATGSGNVINDGGSSVTERGLCWSTHHEPTINGTHIMAGEGTGEFTAAMNNLGANTTYYVRAYATNGAGTSYGDEVEFATLSVSVPSVITASVTNIGQTTATGGGNVISSGGEIVTERGICWSTSHNPTISGSHQGNGTGTGNYTVNMTGLNPNTTYYVRAYAINSQGIAYGEEVNFKTGAISQPSVTTNNVTNITQTTATCGGNVTSDGGATVTVRGVCWSTSPNPTVNGSHTTNGSGTGNFTSNITGLTQNTTYYVRAYATNSAGTSYGEQKSFKTSSVNLPTVTTNNVTNITQNSATCGGNVVSNGGATVTARGVCWSNTNSLPTISNSHTTNGSGTGSFTSSMTGLNAGTTYYVRAYATNSAGTGYGEVRLFTTVSALEGWLYYGEWNNHWQCWGLTNGGTKEWAVMFPTSILSQYAGTSITRVDAYIGETGTYTLKIYRGGSSQPTTLVWTQSFTVSGSTGWNTITISPLTLNTSYNLWVSVTGTHEAGQYPAGSCAGINNPNARWNNNNGNGWTDMYNNNGNVDFCFEIQAWVTDQTKGGKGLEVQLPQTTITPQQANEIKSSRNPNEGSKKNKR